MSDAKLLMSLNRLLAQQRLQSQGETKTTDKAPRDLFARISTKEICLITRQLVTLLRAGMPLAQALFALSEQLGDSIGQASNRKHAYLAAVLQDIYTQVNAGQAFSEALSHYPRLFSPLYIHMVETGQATGNLETTLQQLADSFEKRIQLTVQIRSALTYPVMMCVVSVGVVLFLVTYVVPNMSQIFQELNRALPWPTMVLIAASQFMHRYLGVLVVVMGVFGALLYRLLRQGPIRQAVDRFLLRVPLVGGLLLKIEIARLTRTMATLLAGGVPILRSLDITRAIIQNRMIQQAWARIEESVRRGVSLAESVKQTGCFPPVVFHILSTGQTSGNLDAGLFDIADMYDQDIQASTKTLASLIEPFVLLAMGVVVGFIVLAMLLPIFEINQTL